MAKQTVQGLILEKVSKLEDKMDQMIPVVEGLKVKASIAGFFAGVLATIISTVVSNFWHK